MYEIADECVDNMVVTLENKNIFLDNNEIDEIRECVQSVLEANAGIEC